MRSMVRSHRTWRLFPTATAKPMLSRPATRNLFWTSPATSCREEENVGTNGKLATLRRRSRAADEDVHESSRALLPIGSRGHVRHADQRAQQVEGIEVLAYVAALDGPFHEGVNRSLDVR